MHSRWMLLVLAVSLALASSPSRFGNVEFTLPEGWITEQSGDSLVLRPRTEQRLVVAIYPVDSSGGAFRARFDDWVARGTANQAVVKKGEIDSQQQPGYETLMQLFLVGSAASPGVQAYIAANPEGKFQAFFVAATSAKAYYDHEKAISAFLSSVNFQSQKEEAGLPSYPAAPGSRLGSSGPAVATQSPRSSSGPAYGSSTGARPTALTRKPGYVVARAVDGSGNPVQRFEVEVRGASLQGYPTSFTVAGENGYLEMQVPDGIYSVIGYALVSYEGQTIRMDLQPRDGMDWRTKAPSKPGILKDFVLQASGLRAGQQEDKWGTSNYGGTITVEELNMLTIPPQTEVEVTLTPIGRLIDGSAGRPLIYRGQLWFNIKDVPVGKYEVSVRVGGRPADFEIRGTGGGAFLGRGPLVFEPNDADTAGTKRVRLLVAAP